MAGELTPVVLLPRYTTLAGIPSAGLAYFSTVAMDVTPFQNAIVSVWRGKVVGTAAVPKLNFEESSDGVNWTLCSGTTANFDPGENTEVQYTAPLKKKWFRLTVELGNVTNTLTFWAAGFLEERET